MRISIFVFITIFFWNNLLSQKDESDVVKKIVFDIVKGELTAPLPFYQTFVLQIKTDGKTNLKSEAHLHKIRIPSRNSITQVNGEYVHRYIGDEIESTNHREILYMHKSSNNLYEIIVPPLSPSTDYDIDMIANLTGKDLDKVVEFVFSEAKGTGTRLNYNKFAKQKNHSFYLDHQKPFRDYPYFIANVVTQLLPSVQSVNKMVINVVGEELVICSINTMMQLISQLIAKKLPYKHLVVLSNSIKNGNIFLNAEIKDGSLNIQNLQTTQDYELTARSKNLTELDSILDGARIELQTLFMVVGAGGGNTALISNTINDIKQKAIKYNRKTIKTLEDAKKTFQSELAEHLNYAISITASTVSKDLVKEGGKRFLADYGMVVLMPGLRNRQSGRKLNTRMIPRPMLGVNFKLRHMNPDARLKNLEPDGALKFLYRTSIFMGLTVGKINTDNDRYEDTFNNVTILTGINYWPIQGLRLTGGAAWLRQKNQNPVITDNPILLSPYLGLSFDLRSLSYLGAGLSKLIF